VLKLEVAPVLIIEMTIQPIGRISCWHTLKCPACDIWYGQKKDFKKWISQKTNSNQFQDNITNNILRQNPKVKIFWISGINGL